MVNKQPSPPEVIRLGGVEYLMSFGLLNTLLAVVGDMPRVSLIGVDTMLRGQVLSEVLSTRDEKGVIVEPFNPFTCKLTGAEVQALIQWVSEHLLDFMLEAVERNLETHKRHEAVLMSLTASGTGS
jgi:hypothetical protein